MHTEAREQEKESLTLNPNSTTNSQISSKTQSHGNQEKTGYKSRIQKREDTQISHGPYLYTNHTQYTYTAATPQHKAIYMSMINMYTSQLYERNPDFKNTPTLAPSNGEATQSKHPSTPLRVVEGRHFPGEHPRGTDTLLH